MSAKTKKKESKKNNAVTYIFSVAVLIVAGLLGYSFFFQGEKPDVGKTKIKATHNAFKEFKKQGELTFLNANKEFISSIDIEVAENDAQREEGLMNRVKLKENQGMIFIFEHEHMLSFWMKNTFISLDMIFVNKDHEIVTIHKNTETLTLDSYQSNAPALYVVEVIAGYCDRHNIKVGDKITWRKI